MGVKIDLMGQRFGRLVVVAYAGQNKQGNSLWICECDCGNMTQPIIGSCLRAGSSSSCGCFRRELTIKKNTTHGQRKSRLYRIWHDMKNRCYRKSSINFDAYGGRGISICEEWRNSFEAFYSWALSNGYTDDLSIDRINVDGNYEPSNCRWASREDQANNKTNNVLVEIDGQVKTISQWAKESGVKNSTIGWRLRNGVTGSALIRPVETSKAEGGTDNQAR